MCNFWIANFSKKLFDKKWNYRFFIRFNKLWKSYKSWFILLLNWLGKKCKKVLDAKGIRDCDYWYWFRVWYQGFGEKCAWMGERVKELGKISSDFWRKEFWWWRGLLVISKIIRINSLSQLIIIRTRKIWIWISRCDSHEIKNIKWKSFGNLKSDKLWK